MIAVLALPVAFIVWTVALSISFYASGFRAGQVDCARYKGKPADERPPMHWANRGWLPRKPTK